jgi:hypothetical protein
MDNAQITNILITLLILLVGFIGTLIFKKLDTFERKIEEILIGDVGHSKDIERLQFDYADHEERISELEKNK